MRLLARLLDGLVAGFASWTVGYHLTLFLRWPSWIAALTWVPLAAFVGFVTRRRSRPMALGAELREAAPVVAVAGFGAFWSMVAFVPFKDNFSCLHRALWQLDHLRAPFSISDTASHGQVLPPLSQFHVTTSHEMLSAFLGRALHIDPLQVYFNLVPALVVCAAVIGTALLGLFLSLEKRRLPLVASGFLLAFLLDAGVMRSFALFGMARISEGKCALVFAGIPLGFLYALRFWRFPSRRNWLLLASVGICGVGWSSTGIFLMPMLIAVLAGSLLLANRGRRSGLRRASSMLCASWYPLAIYWVASHSFLPKVTDTSVWSSSWPADWWQNLLLIVSGPWELLGHLLVLVFGALLALQGQRRKFVLCVPVVLALLCFNGLTGPILIDLVRPGAYWRLGYILDFPVGLGLLAAGTAAASLQHRILTCLILAAALLTGRPYAVPGQHGILSKPPLALKFWPAEEAGARATIPLLTERRLLAPEQFTCTIALLDPTLEFDSTRAVEVRHLWKNVGRAEEGEQRARAQEFLARPRDPALQAAFKSALASGLNQIVVDDAKLSQVRQVIGDAGLEYRVDRLSPSFHLVRIVR